MDFYPSRYSALSVMEINELYRAETWAALSRDERLDALQELSNRSAAYLGTTPCEVRLEAMNGAQYGGYLDGQIVVNESLVESGTFRAQLDDGSIASYAARDANAQLMDTIHHENFHAYQDEAMNGRLDTYDVEQVEQWRENDRNYTTEAPFYRVQSIEASAFDYGEYQTTASFEAIEARHGVDPGYQEYRTTIGENSYDTAIADILELTDGQQSLEASAIDHAATAPDEQPMERWTETSVETLSTSSAEAGDVDAM